MANLIDKHGRSFRSLRLSVTSACNFACAYCNPQRVPLRPDLLRPPAFYLDLVRKVLGVAALKDVHLTGGEPTLYSRLPELIAGLRALGLQRVSLTSNGSSLASLVQAYQAAGLTDCNISLDAITPEGFERMSASRNLNDVLQAIEACLRCGLPVKVNCTVMRGRNDHEILPLFEYLSGRGVVVRYLELMKMGPLQSEHNRLFFPMAEIVERIGERYQLAELPRETAATARYFALADGRRFGVIANHSASFCGDCNRLRIAHDGRFFGCISSTNSHSLSAYSDISQASGAPGAAMTALLTAALADKQPSFSGCATSMQEIGG